MPRLIDYAGRFSFLEQAAFEVVLRHGVGRLSFNALAEQLGVSSATVRRAVWADADLTVLAVHEAARRRRAGRWQRAEDSEDGDVLGQSVRQLRRLLPDSRERIAEELVWWKLLLEHIDPPADTGSAEFGEEGLTLAQRFRIATVGYLDRPATTTPAGRSAPVELVRAFDERRVDIELRLEHALRPVLGGAADPWAVTSTRLFVTGLSIEVCSGAVPPEDVPGLVRDHVRGLTAAARP